MSIIVYSLQNCPHCEELKEHLKALAVPFVVRDMQTAESIAELRCNQVFAIEAPVLQVGGETFYTSEDLFDGKGIIKSNINAAIEKRS
jgi:glutaredoxin